jgi:hypothetical protein
MSDNKLIALPNPSLQLRPSGLLLSALLMMQVSCVTKKPDASAASQKSDSAGAFAEPAEDKELNPAEKLVIHGGAETPKLEAGRGLLWFPFVWSPVLIQPEKDSGLTAVENLIIREPNLIFRNTATKSEVLINLREESGAKEANLQSAKNQDGHQFRFYLPRILSLPAGEYVIEGIRTTLGVRGQARETPVTMPFVNPFQISAAKSLQVKVAEGRVSTIARVVQTTSIANAAQGLSLKTISENLDNDVVPVGLVVQHLGRQGSSLTSAIIPATSDFPRLRLELTDDKNEVPKSDEKIAKIGFIVDSPCSAAGSIRIIWKRSNDDKEYLSQFPIAKGDQNCTERHSHGFVFSAPSGDWLPKSTLISAGFNGMAGIQTVWLKAPSPMIKEYFSLARPRHAWTLETKREREIRRALIVPVESVSRKFAELKKTVDTYQPSAFGRSSDVLFLGHFDIRVSSAKNDRAELWDFELKSGYDLAQARKLLAANDLFNAYTLEKLTSGRSNNTNIILRTAADPDDQSSVGPVAAELQGEARRAYALCMKEREESDPLVSLGGMLRFTVLKGSDSLNLKSRRTDKNNLVENWLESCLKKKLLGFRFSNKSPVNFQGEFKFGKDM